MNICLLNNIHVAHTFITVLVFIHKTVVFSNQSLGCSIVCWISVENHILCSLIQRVESGANQMSNDFCSPLPISEKQPLHIYLSLSVCMPARPFQLAIWRRHSSSYVPLFECWSSSMNRSTNKIYLIKNRFFSSS